MPYCWQRHASPPQVLAHAHLQQQLPAQQAVLAAAPQEIRLTFSEGIEPGFSKITLTDAKRHPVKTGQLHTLAGQQQVAIVSVDSPLAAGEYQVDWQVVSVDGHKTRGSYRFTMK
ncbi:copper homeostasis periplasmic binding protein CopC [Shimwellia pseudoproteus]|uniref:copper homeostasis periplasmic binding protein CopC n=1 Tax=Shimwellia pseudoproteus TaxID=570012 RepID=UPI001E516A1E|nr:copper homeostasis periplasmic binding protein CopC [Shimwellia pseudoproteus]